MVLPWLNCSEISLWPRYAWDFSHDLKWPIQKLGLITLIFFFETALNTDLLHFWVNCPSHRYYVCHLHNTGTMQLCLGWHGNSWLMRFFSSFVCKRGVFHELSRIRTYFSEMELGHSWRKKNVVKTPIMLLLSLFFKFCKKKQVMNNVPSFFFCI